MIARHAEPATSQVEENTSVEPTGRSGDADSSGGSFFVWLVGLGVLGIYLGCELYLLSGRVGLPLDDSWIHLQFARHLAGGAGLVYNPGEWSTGSTAPLWTALLALGFLAPGSEIAWAKLLGSLCYLASADASARLAGELGLGTGWRRLAAVLVLATPWLAWSALSGMEICLFAAASQWGILLHLRERRNRDAIPASLAALALACLARPEGYALLALATTDRLFRFERTGEALRLRFAGIRPIVPGLLAAALILVPTLIFYRSVGGSFLPSTFGAKATPMSDLLPSGPYLRTVLDIFFRSQPILLLAAGAGALALVERLGGPRDRGLLPALWLFGLPLAFSLLAPEHGHLPVGNFGRYYFPLLPIVIVLGLLGLESTARRLRPLGGLVLAGRWLPVRAALVGLLLLPQVAGLADGCFRYARTVANVEDSDVRAARWLAERLPPGALLAVQDIGALKYLLPNRVLDLAGIVTPEILPILRGGGEGDHSYWESRVLAFLGEKRPDYLVVFPKSFPVLTSSAPGFERIRTFEVDDNLAMISDELAIFSTPWTRHPLRNLPEPPS